MNINELGEDLEQQFGNACRFSLMHFITTKRCIPVLKRTDISLCILQQNTQTRAENVIKPIKSRTKNVINVVKSRAKNVISTI